MSCQLILEGEAKAEFLEAFAWYEEQAEHLGVRFVHDVDRVMAAICANPLRFSLAGRLNRRAQVRGWPYTIYFAINAKRREIKVVAVWHGARDPATLRRRLK
ncbi:MAG: type II toxin-antitoxin system RelE/ParE family toxin [Verrucomicrobiota bacterium]